ncbi:MAG: hypothetical protein G01um101431_1154 [Parcubacteria group bacterium Gr01-1014_31]|nr:MAG: hypothetical protein G01um101431_1154 [Parcubacteria group bacterium Gr01-1014_31]
MRYHTGMETPPTAAQEITSITTATAAYIKEHLGGWRWVILVIAIAWSGATVWLGIQNRWDDDGIGIVAFLPWIAILIYVGIVQSKIREQFWQQFAARLGFSYEKSGDPALERATRFQQGHSKKMSHVVAGERNGRPLRLFTYQYTVGSGKNSHTYYYTVVEFKVAGRFPHLYLDSRSNWDGAGKGVKIPLPSEFEKEFRLLAPKEYEIEALQIFTPDVLAYLLDTKLQYDVELVDQELLVIIGGLANTLEKLERDFATAINLFNRLAPVLDKMRFTEIKYHSPALG